MSELSNNTGNGQELSPDDELANKLVNFIKQGLKKDGIKNLNKEDSKEIIRDLTVNRKKYDFSVVKEKLTDSFIDNNGIVPPKVLKVIKNLYDFIQYLQRVRLMSLIGLALVILSIGTLGYLESVFVWAVVILAPIIAIILYMRVLYKSYRMIRNIFNVTPSS